MDHLFAPLNDDPVFLNVSPGYQLMASHRSMVRPVTLLAALDAGWMAPIDQQDPVMQRSMLLAYMGTFTAHARNERPAAPVTAVDLEAEFLALAGTPQQAAPLYHRGGVLPRSPDTSQHGDPLEVAHRMLDLGADVFAQDREGRDALDQAFSLQWTPVLRRMLADPRANAAALAQRTQYVKRREPANGTHPGTTGPADGMALPWLHAAAAKGRDAMLDELLDHGMDVNQRDAFGRTPMFYAPFDGTLAHLLARGADPLVRDRFGELPNAAWVRFGLASDQVGPMTTRFLQALRTAPGLDTERLKDEQRPALFHQACHATVPNFTSFVRNHGFSPDETLVLDGHEVSLLGIVALQGLSEDRHSPSIGSMLVSKARNPMHETVAGVPDVVLMWLFANAVWMNQGVKAREASGKAMARCFGWDRPGGFERSLETTLLPVFERLLHGDAAQDPELAWFRERTRMGQVRSGIIGGLSHALEQAPFVVPASAPDRPTVTDELGGAVTPPVHDAWQQALLADGTSLVWRWAALAARHDGEDQDSGLNSVHNTVQTLVGGTAQMVFRVTPDAEAVPALLDVLGHGALLINSTMPSCDWGRGSLVTALHHAIVDLGLPLNTHRPGMALTMERLSHKHPELFRAIERRILEQTVSGTGMAQEAQEARVRPRL